MIQFVENIVVVYLKFKIWYDKESIRFAEKIVKVYPVIINVVLVAMGVEYFLRIRYISDLLSPLLGYSSAVVLLLYALSKRFKLCLWNKIFISNMAISNIMDILSKHGYNIPNAVYFLAISAALSILIGFTIWLNVMKSQQY
jgi:hypothetical protein